MKTPAAALELSNEIIIQALREEITSLRARLKITQNGAKARTLECIRLRKAVENLRKRVSAHVYWTSVIDSLDDHEETEVPEHLSNKWERNKEGG